MYIRGRFFLRRVIIFIIVGMFSGFVIGKFLDMYNSFLGFFIVFVFVVIMGMFDIVCFFFVKDIFMKV